jgi:hypothetical protein
VVAIWLAAIRASTTRAIQLFAVTVQVLAAMGRLAAVIRVPFVISVSIASVSVAIRFFYRCYQEILSQTSAIAIDFPCHRHWMDLFLFPLRFFSIPAALAAKNSEPLLPLFPFDLLYRLGMPKNT